jgi:ABC-type transport system involved in multi-copper enzyme maturation permease subunit
MIRLLIEKEIRDIVGSTKFAITFAVCAALIFLAFFAGASNYKASRSQYEAAVATNLRQLDGLTDWKDVSSTRVFLPPQPLNVLVSGVWNDIGRTTEVAGLGDLVAEDTKYSEEPVFAVFRFLDLDFIFQVVLSLFAILLAYDAITGEKERGTLRLIFANSVPRASFILGKLIGMSVALIVPLLCAVAVGSLLLPVLGVPMSGQDWLRLGIIVLVGSLYLIAMLIMTILISAMTKRSSSTLLASLIVWVLFVMVIPRASVLLAGRTVSVPSLDEINSQKAKYAAQLRLEDMDRMEQFKPATTGDVDGMMKELNEFMSNGAMERDRKMKEFGGRLEENRHNHQKAQARVALTIARLSPATSLSLALANLAETSLDLKDQYHDQAIAYQQEFGKFIQAKTGMNLGGGLRMITLGGPQDNTGVPPKRIDPQELPSFTFRPNGTAVSVGSAAVDIGLLMLFGLVFFGGAFAAIYRYDLR